MANLTGKLEHRITLRLTDREYQQLITISNYNGCTPSNYLRTLIDSTFSKKKFFMEGSSYENERNDHNGYME